MKFLFTLIILVSNICVICAQDTFSRISLSGFEVSLIPSDTFSIHFDKPQAIERIVKDDTLQITVLDQTGVVPKGSIVIRTDKLEYLQLYNCKLVMHKQMICDSFELVTASSFGTLKIKADSLSVNIGAGSNFTIQGRTQFFDCAVGGASTLQSSKLIADQAEINVMGYSQLYFNAKEVLTSDIKNSNAKNKYKE